MPEVSIPSLSKWDITASAPATFKNTLFFTSLLTKFAAINCASLKLSFVISSNSAPKFIIILPSTYKDDTIIKKYSNFVVKFCNEISKFIANLSKLT